MPVAESFRPWWPGKGEEVDPVDELLSPHGNAPVTAIDRGEALAQLMAEGYFAAQVEPVLPGLWEHGVSPAEKLREYQRLLRDRAQAIANAKLAKQMVNTTDDVKVESNG